MGDRTCSEDGCEKPAYCRERCQKHYLRFLQIAGRKYPDPQIARGSYEGCWEWTGYEAGEGLSRYGRASIGGRQTLVHRAVYEAIYGAFDPSLLVCHRCDNPRCFRPDHLFLGTYAQNTADMMAKGRGARGQRQHLAKLTDADVTMIRHRHEAGETKEAMARTFGVNPRTIEDVITRRTWKHVA